MRKLVNYHKTYIQGLLTQTQHQIHGKNTGDCWSLREDFCRSCEQCDSSGWHMVFGEGTKLIVTASGE
jgi:hypothetical protein